MFLDDLIKDSEPITEWNIKNIHQLILKGIDNENAGRYRKENVTIKGATHIPPDYLSLPELMEKLILTYNTWSEYHAIIQAALLHGELVKIHPFVDGNGRTARLIMNLDLIRNGFPPINVKFTDRKRYYDAFDAYYKEDDAMPMIELIAEYVDKRFDDYFGVLVNNF